MQYSVVNEMMQNYTSKPTFSDTRSLYLANVDILHLALNEKRMISLHVQLLHEIQDKVTA